MYHASIKLEYSDHTRASIIFSSVNVDNDMYVKGILKDNSIVFEISCDSSGTLKNTINDLLSCVSSVEGID